MQLQKFADSLSPSSTGECSYFPDRHSHSKIFSYHEPLSPLMVDEILDVGFRRSGFYFYKTACFACRRCIGYRLPIQAFRLSRSQKRILNKNKDVQLLVRQPSADKEKEELYSRYQYQQHFQKPIIGMEKDEFSKKEVLETMHHQMYDNVLNSIEMELRLEEQLLGFAVFDIGTNSISAVYSVYEPDLPQRSLGKLMILRSLQWAAHMSYRYFYLGIFIEDHAKMDYKKEFQKAEVLYPQQKKWQFFQKPIDS